MGEVASSNQCSLDLRTLGPLTAFKKGLETQDLSRRLFFGFQVGRPKIVNFERLVQKLKNGSSWKLLKIFRQNLGNFGFPDLEPEKQSSGQMLDKFGFRGLFECCKGPESLQPLKSRTPAS